MNSRKSYIEKLVEQGEHQTQDFKFEVSDSKKIARTLSAFSNTNGGKLLIGVKDNGALAGVRSEEEFHMLQAAAQMYCKPEVPLKFKEWNVLGKLILEVSIKKTEEELVSAPDKNGAFKVFIRLNDQNILANGMFIKAWQQKRNARPVKINYTDIEKEFLNQINEKQPISWSQLRKQLKLTPKKTNQLLLDFLLLEIIELKISEKGYFYQLNEKQFEKVESIWK
ncbi:MULTISPECIES: helix-turn-helix domain-containing protein [unclassified Lentimicrobium]|uniref:AlbA family DNA-binding domain-containing protein n=1 Tax=unclassified Lentimicrobium TaxID=2677434 RepID=UPI0015565982|nr:MULTISPECIES: ATP-binding protein [unclassified Lentimicrobium]NPD44533.1 ATP-binding protein [Lentimicrobium sp. S6]NPD85650.1 ATP-binding protein [Lentimicrobium sp. L6]